MSRIYLDNAATSWPKPPQVIEAVETYLRSSGAAVGRGATRSGARLQQTVDRCRGRAARLLGVASPRQVIFTYSGTDALNLALQGWLRPGDHVVTTDIEHNSILRPLHGLRRRLGIEVRYVSADDAGVVSPAEVAAAIEPRTRLVAVSHVSNVTGAIQPIEEIVAAARRRGVYTLVDAAQSAGHLPVSMRDIGCDLLACSGHKGLLGPLGTGLLCLAEGVEAQLESLRQGGTGSHSEEESQPDLLPDKYEAGNHNAPGLVGLDAALEWIESRGIAALQQESQAQRTALLSGLAGLPGVRTHGPRDAARCAGVVSFTVAGYDPREVAALLDSEYGIECRAGLHCAPRMHRSLGTADTGGTVRFSPGPFTTDDELTLAVTAIASLTAG